MHVDLVRNFTKL